MDEENGHHGAWENSGLYILCQADQIAMTLAKNSGARDQEFGLPVKAT